MEKLEKIINGWKQLTIAAKLFMLDIYGGPGYAYVIFQCLKKPTQMKQISLSTN